MSDIKLKTLEIEDLGTYTVENKAEIDGNHDELTSGTAKAVLSTTYETDSEPYNFRKSKSNGNRKSVEKLVGGTIAWNQLVQNGDFSDGLTGWSFIGDVTATVENGAIKIVANSNNTSVIRQPEAFQVKYEVGHKYLISSDFKQDQQTTNPYHFCLNDASLSNSGAFRDVFNGAEVGKWFTKRTILEATESWKGIRAGFYSSALMQAGEIIYLRNIMIIDLTAAWQSTIADRIYSLEQATTGAGVAWFRKYFPKEYYAYSEPTFLHSKISAMETVGFNAWDEETRKGYYSVSTGEFVANNINLASANPIPILPNTTYYFKNPVVYNIVVLYYDKNLDYIGHDIRTSAGTFTTPNNAAYAYFYMSEYYGTTYKNDICINISDPSRNGTYEPYKKHTCAVDNIDLKGIFKLDSNNELYAEGDTYEPSGQHETDWAEIDLGTLTWVYIESSANFYANLPANAMSPIAHGRDALCTKYAVVKPETTTSFGTLDKVCNVLNSAFSASKRVLLRDSAYTDATALKTALSGVMLLYPIEPITESVEPYQQIQVVDTHGTESMVDERDVAVPMGHETHYYEDIAKKVSEMLPSSPTTAGNYVLELAVNSQGIVTTMWSLK